MAKEASGRRPALIEAQRFDGKPAFAFVDPAAWRRFRGRQRGRGIRDDLSPWCLAKLAEKPARRHVQARPRQPGKAALGWLLAQHRFNDYRSKKDEQERGPRVLVTASLAKIDEMVRLAEATACWCATWSIRPPRIWARASSSKRSRDAANALGGTGPRSRSGKTARRLSVDRGGRRRRSEERAPRLIELEWGKLDDPRVADRWQRRLFRQRRSRS